MWVGWAPSERALLFVLALKRVSQRNFIFGTPVDCANRTSCSLPNFLNLLIEHVGVEGFQTTAVPRRRSLHNLRNNEMYTVAGMNFMTAAVRNEPLGLDERE